jgi:F-type H+-transporting ATPase subunit gamma
VNLINLAQKFLKEQEGQGREVQAHVIGRRGCDFFRRRKLDMTTQMPGVMNVIDFDLAVSIARLGLNSFLAGEVQEVYVIYSDFRSMASIVPTVDRILPIQPEPSEGEEEATGGLEYITEPSAEEILVDLLPRYLNVRTYSSLLNTATSEQASRMTAMDNATKNCKEMIENLTLVFNKARQAAITAELMDIVGGAEALSQG